MDRVDALTGLALAIGLALTGLTENLLKSAGMETLGTLVWPVGYGTVVIVAWYLWIRPLDLHPPGTEDDRA